MACRRLYQTSDASFAPDFVDGTHRVSLNSGSWFKTKRVYHIFSLGRLQGKENKCSAALDRSGPAIGKRGYKHVLCL